MKALKSLGLFLLIAGIVPVTSSCSEEFNIPEITQDTEINLDLSADFGISKLTYYPGKTTDEISLLPLNRVQFARHIKFPAGGICTIYPDSVVVKTANQHKLKIIFKK